MQNRQPKYQVEQKARKSLIEQRLTPLNFSRYENQV